MISSKACLQGGTQSNHPPILLDCTDACSLGVHCVCSFDTTTGESWVDEEALGNLSEALRGTVRHVD